MVLACRASNECDRARGPVIPTRSSDSVIHSLVLESTSYRHSFGKDLDLPFSRKLPHARTASTLIRRLFYRGKTSGFAGESPDSVIARRSMSAFGFPTNIISLVVPL